MCVLREISIIYRTGARVLRDASRGKYKFESKEVAEIKKELFKDSDKYDDKAKLLEDRKAIEKDVRDAWEKVKLSHG